MKGLLLSACTHCSTWWKPRYVRDGLCIECDRLPRPDPEDVR